VFVSSSEHVTSANDATCRHCGQPLAFERYHAGFSNEGFMYCDRDASVVIWSTYDERYESLVGDVHPWMLAAEQQSLVEAAMSTCPCGGRFAFENPPLCPHCSREVSYLAPSREYFLILGRRFDAEPDAMWRTT
jgi:hypothetical protein